MKQSELKQGDKVHYIPFEDCDDSQKENGIVKMIPDHTDFAVFVVYHWNGKSGDFRDYTAALTNLRDLKKGWINPFK
jgi:hypothetical protein